MIKRIYADNFTCLVNLEFQPRQLNLLLGDNGSGKTSLFKVLLLLRELVVVGRSVSDLFAHTKTIWDRRDLQSFELDIEGFDGVFSYRLEIRYRPGEPARELQINTEVLVFNGQELFRYGEGQVQLFDNDHSPGAAFPFKPDRSFLPNIGSPDSKLQWFKDFLFGIHIFRLNPFALDPFSQQDYPGLMTNGSNFASWLRYLSEEKPQAKLECEKRLAEVMPGFQRFLFRSMGDRKILLADFTKEDGESYQLALADFSEGQRILAILYSVLYGSGIGPGSVLCFDEPENFISLPEVQPWLQSLRDLVEENSGQALVISHHPEVIDYLAADSAFLFERPNGGLVKVSPWQADSEPDQPMKPSEILVRGG